MSEGVGGERKRKTDGEQRKEREPTLEKGEKATAIRYTTSRHEERSQKDACVCEREEREIFKEKEPVCLQPSCS